MDKETTVKGVLEIDQASVEKYKRLCKGQDGIVILVESKGKGKMLGHSTSIKILIKVNKSLDMFDAYQCIMQMLETLYDKTTLKIVRESFKYFVIQVKKQLTCSRSELQEADDYLEEMV